MTTSEAIKRRREARNKVRQARWESNLCREAAALMARFPDHVDEIEKMLEAALAEGPDFIHYRRDALHLAPPKVDMDANARARIMQAVRTVEARTYANRKKGSHGGRLGAAAVRLMEILMFVVNGGGYLSPSQAALARLARCSEKTIRKAIGRLKHFGFLTSYRRIRRIPTLLGAKIVRDTNAYAYHLPGGGLGALALTLFGQRSNGTNSRAKETENSRKEGREGKGLNPAGDGCGGTIMMPA